MDFSRFETFIFDLDGTIWNWQKLFPGVRETIKRLREKGKKIIFLTNNSMLSRAGLVRRLRKLGLEVEENELITSSFVAAQYLKKRRASAFAIGKGLKEELKRVGVKLTEKNPDFVVVGQDQQFNIKKLAKVWEIMKEKTKIIGIASGRVWMMGKKLVPATGCILVAIEFISGKKAIFVGKPSDEMIKVVKAFVHSPKEKTAIFGDECSADIGMGKKLGYFTVLVRTGIDKKCNIATDAVIDSIAEIEV